MSVSEQLFLPFDDSDIAHNAFENNTPIYINDVLALGDIVRRALPPFDEAEERHAVRRLKMVNQASLYYEQKLYPAAISELRAIRQDYEIAQGPTFLPDIDFAIERCRQQQSVRDIAHTAIRERRNKTAS